MTKSEMLERSRAALAEFSRLPPEEQFRQLVAWGVLDANGEVRFHRDGRTVPMPEENRAVRRSEERTR